VAALKEGGRFTAYYEHLVPELEAEVLDCVAGSWVSIAAARAHYRACDALALTAAEQMALGHRTGGRLTAHLTHLVGCMSRGAGGAPWWLLAQFNRFWTRAFEGGGVSVVRVGPKEALVTYAHCSLLESPYFRSALRGVATSVLASATHRSFMSELAPPTSRRPGDDAPSQVARSAGPSVRYRFSWV
jgi:hypothetical protein